MNGSEVSGAGIQHTSVLKPFLQSKIQFSSKSLAPWLLFLGIEFGGISLEKWKALVGQGSVPPVLSATGLGRRLVIKIRRSGLSLLQ